MKKRLFVGIVFILLLAGSTLPGPFLNASAELLQEPPPVPPNDDFDNAIVILNLPYTDAQDTSSATWANDDPGDCTSNGSVWYALTPTSDIIVDANTFGSNYDTVLSVYTGSRGALTMVPGACNDDYQGLNSRVHFNATAGATYYFLIGFCCGTGGNGGGALTFTVQAIAAPANDNFADAISISGLPFSDSQDTSGASLESEEARPSCAYDSWGRSVWYAYTPAQSGSITARTEASFYAGSAAYTGASVTGLTQVGSRCGWGEPLTFRAQAGMTYYFQVGDMDGNGGPLTFYLDVSPPPMAELWFYPGDPSRFDTVWFYNYSWDPAGAGFESAEWDFGDGTTSTEWSDLSHQYPTDGDYTLRLTVITEDSRSASTTRTIQVRTHDVAITKLVVPKAAAARQTRSIVVNVNSRRYPEQVMVELWKSVPGGYAWVGSLTQSVPVRSANRTTPFSFNYTFTTDDASVGKVTFRATATIVSARDALPADNEAIGSPTKVSR